MKNRAAQKLSFRRTFKVKPGGPRDVTRAADEITMLDELVDSVVMPEDLPALLATNKLRGTPKIVSTLAQRNALQVLGVLTLATTCFVANPATPEDIEAGRVVPGKTFVVSRNDLLPVGQGFAAYIDGGETQQTCKAEWVADGTPEAQAATLPFWDSRGLLPGGFYPEGFTFKYLIGDKLYIFDTLQVLHAGNFAGVLPVPTLVANDYYQPSSAPVGPATVLSMTLSPASARQLVSGSKVRPIQYVIERRDDGEGQPQAPIVVRGLSTTQYTPQAWLLPLDGSTPILGTYDLDSEDPEGTFIPGGSTSPGGGVTPEQLAVALASKVGNQDPRLVAVPVAVRIQQDDTVTRYTNIGSAIAEMSLDGTDILHLSGYIAAVNFDRPGVYYCHNLLADYVGLGGYPNADRGPLTCKIIGLTWRKRLCPLTQGLGASTYHVIDAQGGENAYIDIYDAFSDRYTPGTNTRDQFIFERVRVHYRGPYGPPDAVAYLPYYYTSGMGSGCVRKNNSNDVRSAADHYFVDCQLRNDYGPVFSGVCQADNRFFLQGDTITSFATSLAEFIDPATAAVMDPAVLDQVVQDQRPVGGGPGGGDVQKVNGQTGIVTLTTANIPPTAARGYVSDGERAAWSAPRGRFCFPDGVSGGVITVENEEAGTYTTFNLFGADSFTLNGGGLPITLVAGQQLTIALMNRAAGEARLYLKP